MSKHENTKKIILVDQVKDGKTYGTLNDKYGDGITGVPISLDNSVTVKEDELNNARRRVGYLLPLVDANPKLIAQTDDSGLVYTQLSNAEVVNDDEVPVPQGFSYETVSLPHYYDLVPTHELAYTVSGKDYHFYRVRMKNSPIAHIRLKQALAEPYFVEEGNDSVRIFDSNSSSGTISNITLACYVSVLSFGVNFLYHKTEVGSFIVPDHTVPPYDIIFNKGIVGEDGEQTVHPTYEAAPATPDEPNAPDDPYEGTLHFALTIDGESVDVTIETPDPRTSPCELLIKFSQVPRPSALAKLKTITFAGLTEEGALDTYNLEYVDSEQCSRKFNWVDTKLVDLDFPHAGEESFIWTQHIAPLNDVSSAEKAPEGIRGIYDVVEKAGIEMFHNTNKAIGKIHRLEQEQTVRITEDCLCIVNSVDESKLDWCQVVHATSQSPLWIDGETLERLSKSGSYVDRLAILIDKTQPNETFEKVVVVSEVVSNGKVIKYKYLPFDDDNDETTPDQTQRASHDEYSFTSYAVEQGGEALAQGKIKVVNRTDDYSEVVVIENSVDNWVGNHYFINSADTFMVDRDGNNGRINLYTANNLQQKVGNGSGGDMWVKIEGAEHGLLDGTDVEDSLLYADPENLAFLVPVPRGKDGMIANMQGGWTISPTPAQLDEFYETETLDGKRQFVVIKNTDDNGYEIYEVAEITFAMEGGNEEP